MTAQSGSGNPFPGGQCTFWASQRYWALTGYSVPWTGNAYQWAGQAPKFGWSVSATPVAPSIICLQPNVQGASASDGHVGIVESLGKNGVVHTSDLNWGTNPGVQTNVDFVAGPGVSFIYVTDAQGKPLNQVKSPASQQVQQVLRSVPIQIGPNADVTNFLYNMDQLFVLNNPFVVTTTDGTTPLQQDSLFGGTFTDPISWIEGFGYNLGMDIMALLLHTIFILVGALLMYRVLNQFIDLGNLPGVFG